MQQSNANTGSASQQDKREADLSQAELTDRYRDVGQIVDVMNGHIQDAGQYLDYLFQYEVDSSSLQQVSNSLKIAASTLSEIQNQVRIEEADQIRTAKKKDREKKINDHDRYAQALRVYETGNIRKARSMFAALARYARNKEVRAYSKQSFDTIVQWENDQQATNAGG